MTKWCFNYESGEYEDIDKEVIVGAEESMSTIGTIANIVSRKRRKKNVVEAKTKMTMIDLFLCLLRGNH